MTGIRAIMRNVLRFVFAPTKDEVSYDRKAMELALQTVVMESLNPAVLALGLMFIFLAFTHYRAIPTVIFPDKIEIPMLIINGVSGLVLVGLRFWLGRHKLSPEYAHPTIGMVAILVAFNVLAHLYLSLDPMLSIYMVLLFTGIGFFFLSTPWYLGVTLGSGVAWALISYLRAPQTPTWITLRYVLGISALIGYIVHNARVRTYRRLEVLRQEQLQQQEEIKHRAIQLKTLIEVAQSVSSILDLDKVLNEVAELIKERFGYYFVGIFLMSEDGQYMVARAGTGSAGRWLTEQRFKLEFRQNSGRFCP